MRYRNIIGHFHEMLFSMHAAWLNAVEADRMKGIGSQTCFPLPLFHFHTLPLFHVTLSCVTHALSRCVPEVLRHPHTLVAALSYLA